jgi:serine/threonine-protein kinase
MTDSTERPLPARLAAALGDAYTIEGEIGRGGMGVVYRARDERLQRRVAIKVLPPELAFQQDIRQRFTREAQTAARLSHPHIVPIHSVGEGQGLVYFVMGYVDGESVGARIKRRGRLPVEEARRIMRETADALSAAHAVSVIHRDIKPDNILLEGTRGRVMVTDFGIAKALSSTSGATLTGVGVAIGTPQFMSPEQAAGEREIDGRSDLYSLGIVTYQMLVGELPFTAPTVAGILMKQITEPAPDLRLRRSDIPEDLALAVLRCLEKDPQNRWPTADALRRALESRVVTGYQPTGLGWRAARPAAGAGRGGTGSAREEVRNRVRGEGLLPAAPRPLSPRPLAPRPLAPRDPMAPRSTWESRRPSHRRDQDTPVPDTGEPKIVQRVRGQFASWAAVSVGCLGINVATGLDAPWFLFPTFGMGIGLLKNYAKLWQAGYSWRDVLSRPSAPDAVETKMRVGAGGKLPRQLPLPKREEFGLHYQEVEQVYKDRQAILRRYEKLAPTVRKDLADIHETVDGLYNRASELARTLHLMDTDIQGEGDIARIDEKLAALQAEPEREQRNRQIDLLERQKRTLTGLMAQRSQVASHLESCVLAMQNLRLDLLKLTSSNVSEVMSDITQATQQARALSRNMDNVIEAAAEIREAMR